MKRISKICLLSLVSIFLLYIPLTAQQNKNSNLKDTTIYKLQPNTINFSFTPEREFNLYYERLLKNNFSIEAGIGIKNGNTSKAVTGNLLSYDKNNDSKWYSGYIFSLGARKYLNENKNPFYISLLLFYKKYSYDQTIVANAYKVNTPTTHDLRSGTKDVLGTKLLAGKRFQFNAQGKVRVVLDTYAGIGIRQKMFNDTYYATIDNNRNWSYHNPPIKEKSDKFVFSGHIGFRLGVAF